MQFYSRNIQFFVLYKILYPIFLYFCATFTMFYTRFTTRSQVHILFTYSFLLSYFKVLTICENVVEYYIYDSEDNYVIK